MLAQICTSPGQTFAISAFIPSLRDALQISETRLTAAYMIGTFVAAFPLMVVGPVADRIGNRAAMTIVVVMLSMACLFASTVQSFAMLLFAFMSLRFLGQGALTLLSGNTTSMWFRRKLGRVTAAMSVGMATAFSILPELLLSSIESFGWRETYRGVGIVIAMLMLPLLAFVYRNRPEDVGQQVDGIAPQPNPPSLGAGGLHTEIHVERSLTMGEAIRGRSFWILSASMAAWAMVGTGLVFHLFSIAEAHNIVGESAAKVFRTFGLSMLAMQLVGGVAADRYPLNRLLCAGMALLSSGAASLLLHDSTIHLHLFGMLFGAGQGLTIAVGATVWVRYYGRDHLGKIRGTALCATVAGSGSGPFFLGWAKDYTGQFEPAIIGFVALMVPLTLLALICSRTAAGRRGYPVKLDLPSIKEESPMPAINVRRSIQIQASPETVFNTVSDFGSWETWSPWLRIDPEAKVTISDDPRSVGSTYRWSGEVVGKERSNIESFSVQTGSKKTCDLLSLSNRRRMCDFHWTLQTMRHKSLGKWTVVCRGSCSG